MPRDDTTASTARVLSAVPDFAGLDPATMEAIAGAAIRRSYDAGQVVLLEGEPCAGLYVVQEGWLKSVKISMAGREQVVRFVGPGEAFNEIGVFAGGLNQATVEALEPAKVWIVRRDPLLRLMDEHPPLAHVITQNLAKRVLYLMGLVEDLSTRSVEARLARHLLEQASEGTLHRQSWATQAELAARLGTVLDVLNRALHSLAEEGLIRVARHQILILDREGLRAKAMLDR